MIKKIQLLMTVVLLGAIFFGGFNVLAFDVPKGGSMMTISPPRERMILMPGETFEGSVNVSNSATATKDLNYSAQVGSFGLRDDENGNADYNNTDVDTITSYNQIMNWITLGKETGTVAPGETDVMPYTITVPEDAPAGGQYASIIIQRINDKEEGGGDVVIENVVEFAVGILAEVAGETRDEGTVIDNNIPALLLSNKLEAGSTVRNDGNVHTDAEYTLQVWPLFSSEEICTNEEEPETSMIMPETERYHAQTCELPSIGIYRARQVVKIFGVSSEVEKTVFYCPLWLIFLILFAIILFIVWIVTRARSRHSKKKNNGSEE